MKDETLEGIVERVIFTNKELLFVEEVCKGFDIKYGMPLLDQLFDRYNDIIKLKYTKHYAKRLVLIDFYEKVEEAYKKEYGLNGDE